MMMNITLKHQKLSLKYREQSFLIKQTRNRSKYRQAKLMEILKTAETPRQSNYPPEASGQLIKLLHQPRD